MNFSRDYRKHKTRANQQGKTSEENISWSMENQKGKKKMNIKDTRDMVKVPTIREENKAKTIFDKIVLPKIFPQMAKTPRNTTNSKKNNYK